MNKITNTDNIATNSKVLDYIESEIIFGKLKKGDKLPTERQLAEDLQVSRATVREAVKALESMGIVTAIQGSGNYITKEMENTVDLAVCALFALNEGSLANIIQLRTALEIEAYRDAVSYASDEELAKVAEAADYDYFNSSLEYISEQDCRFHQSIMDLSHNSLIKYLYNTLYSLMDMYRSEVLSATAIRNENALTKSGHEAIVSALMNRDFHGAELAIREHLSLNDDYCEMLRKKC